MSRSALAEIDFRLLNLQIWPDINECVLADDVRQLVSTRRTAIRLLVSGESDAEIFAETGIHRRDAVRWVKRCLEAHADGRIFGFRALIPYTHVVVYRRKEDSDSLVSENGAGLAGSFDQLLRSHPELKTLIDTAVLKLSKKNHVHESRIPLKNLHKRFLDRCREFGLDNPRRYPFTTRTLGHRALSVYVRKLILEAANKAPKDVLGSDAAKKMQAGDGTSRPIFKAYQRVECDAHHIDAIFCILIPSIFGELIPKVIRRLWLIVIKEVASRAILGYSLSLREEINQDDLLSAIQFALSPWEPRALSIPTLTYRRNAGFPSSRNSRLVGGCWNEFSVDGALANHADRVKTVLREVVGSEPFTLARHNPNDRPFVERFFLTLEEAGFHRLPNTTGSNPDDPRRSDPEKAAVRYEMNLEHLLDLIDVMIANFNADPHTSNGYRSPLEYLEYLCAHASDWPRTVDQIKVKKLTTRRRSVYVRGNMQSGHRPHVNFEGVKYTNDLLRTSLGLIGKQIHVEWEGDIRTIRAFTEKGTELGSLRAAPPWNKTPHTLEMRRAVNSLRQRKVLHYLENSDPIEAYLEYLRSASVKSRVVPSAYLKATQLQAETQGSPVLAGSGASHRIAMNGSDNKVVAINASASPVYRKGRKAING